MKINKWLAILLIVIGTCVGAISLYMASISGVMGKMGLVGGDLNQSIDGNELARKLMDLNDSANCSLWQVGSEVSSYLFSKGEERIGRSGELGGVRIICGVKHVQNGNVERGIYTIIKGLYYLKTHYSEMRIEVEQNRDQCHLLNTPNYERWVEAYLGATEGRVHEVVLGMYRQVEIERASVEELCIE